MIAVVNIGFTGGRQVDDVVVYGNLYKYVKLLYPPLGSSFITGACVGADSIIGQWLVEEMPHGHFHHIIVPNNKSRVDYWWQTSERAQELISLGFLTVQYMPPSTTYKDRNQAIVNRSDWVYGFPAYDQDDLRSLRSGTWQTIRMAIKAEKYKVSTFPSWPRP